LAVNDYWHAMHVLLHCETKLMKQQKVE